MASNDSRTTYNSGTWTWTYNATKGTWRHWPFIVKPEQDGKLWEAARQWLRLWGGYSTPEQAMDAADRNRLVSPRVPVVNLGANTPRLVTWTVDANGLFGWFGPGSPLVDLSPCKRSSEPVFLGGSYQTREEAGRALRRAVRAWGAKSLESRPAELKRRMAAAA